MDERCGFIERLDGYGFDGSHEQKTAPHSYLCVSAAILADEDQSRSAIGHI
jgi:hypothetical protein